MGKKVKKKARSGQKEKRVATASPQSIPQTIQNDVVSVAKERKICPHLDKGVDLDKLSSKIKSLEPVKCEDCREGTLDRRAGKSGGKGKSGKKKGGGESKSDSKSIWVCLECGQFSCGGAGFPTTPQSHAVRHSRQYRHPLAVKFENPNLRWCFPCSSPIPIFENGEQKDLLPDIIKIIKSRPVEANSVDVEDVWFGSGSVISEIKSESNNACNEPGGGYVVRGLVNLGNTCFFNSVMQNLLAMDKVRDYFLNLDRSIGPLTVSLKKLFVETNPSSGSRNVVNPKPFFGCLCTKSPQFRGFQQHDSHELLRCLLDALCTEELCERKEANSNSCKENGVSLNLGPTFVDKIFGGKLSSTVCCVKCGHSSIVYEPFLDVSLPVPTKKPPPKKAQPVLKGKKPKLPPKRTGRIRPKLSRDTEMQSTSTVASENLASSSVDSTPLDSQGVEDEKLVESTPLDSQGIENKKLVENVEVEIETLTWLDFVDFGTISNDDDKALEIENGLLIHDDSFEASEPACSSSANEKTDLPNDLSVDLNELGKLSVEIDNSLVTQDSLLQDPNNDNTLNNDSVNSCEEPLQVQDSEIILLPYKEEEKIESPVEQSTLDFDGFGDLFNEPDDVAVMGPAMKPNETSFTVGNSSGSDPDEVDNSNSPVSVESCLAHFTQPELLSKNEHAWHCESCSKSAMIQRRRSKKKKIVLIDDGSLSCNGDLERVSMTNDVVVDDDDYDDDDDDDDDEDDDVADSENVKVKRDATKRLLINNAPPILTVHLKRFTQDARARLSKLNGHVDFREIIDLRPYMDPRCTEREKYEYRLVGVVEHLGSMRGGHYVAYVRGGPRKKREKNDNDDERENGDSSSSYSMWYHTSDAHVREATFEEVLKCEAYILFYEEI